MKLVQWLTMGSVAAGLVVVAIAGSGASREVWLGMFGPLAVVDLTWIVMERVYKTQPERLTSIMIAALAGKLVFFGAYVALAVVVLGVQPVPFVVSFTSFFIVLHLIEAFFLRRLFVS
jgi:hypothetical protein